VAARLAIATVREVRAVVAFIRLGRPLFLGGGFLLYGLGAALAALAGHPIDATRFVQGQIAVTAFQWMTHYANEYYDYDADLANATPTRWSGGSRVLPGGQLPRAAALAGALAFAAIGVAVSIALADTGGATTATLAAIAALAWSYSAPPMRLCARGAGELATALVVTGLVPWLGFHLQAPGGRGATTLALAIAPLALLQLAMLLAIELPDAAGDAATGKRTLVVRLGAARAAALYAAVTALAYLWLPLAWRLGLPGPIALAATIAAPLAVWRVIRTAGDHRDRAAFERLTTCAVLLLVTTAAAELAAVLALIAARS
jgi:1,4-dihydroxy-2-naphthoate octaprenyltransferase